MIKPNESPVLAFKNRERLKSTCGCYKCVETFESSEIVEWTDQEETALCPRCGTDTVLEEIDNLQQVHDHWFKKKA